MNSKGIKEDNWTAEEHKYHLLAEKKRRHHERLAKEECEAKMVQDKKLFEDNKSKLFELTKEEAKKQEELLIEQESHYQSTNRESQLKFVDEQERRLDSISRDENKTKTSLAQSVKNQEVLAQTEFANLQEFENQELEEGEKSKLYKEGRALVFQDEVRKEEEENALLENRKRLQKQEDHYQEKEKIEKIEMERASAEIENRQRTALLVTEHELEFTKMLDETHQAKLRDEASKGKRWEEEKLNEDLEMEEKIKARNALLKQKLLEYEKIREETENDAKAIESNVLKLSKEYKEKRLEQIDIDQFHEEERRKKEEGVKKREMLEQKRKEIDSLKFEMEKTALAKEKEKRKDVLVKQEAELNRFEQEIKKGDDERTRRELEKMKIIEQQIEQEEKEAFDIFYRQKIRNQELDTKKDSIAKDAESFVEIQASKRKNLDDSKREVEKIILNDEREREEERIRLEGSRRRELQIKLQQEEILKQQEAEMELLMKSKRVKASVIEEDADDIRQKPKTKNEKKRIFGLFHKRSTKE